MRTQQEIQELAATFGSRGGRGSGFEAAIQQMFVGIMSRDEATPKKPKKSKRLALTRLATGRVAASEADYFPSIATKKKKPRRHKRLPPVEKSKSPFGAYESRWDDAEKAAKKRAKKKR